MTYNEYKSICKALHKIGARHITISSNVADKIEALHYSIAFNKRMGVWCEWKENERKFMFDFIEFREDATLADDHFNVFLTEDDLLKIEV
jgi:hypothetical protein